MIGDDSNHGLSQLETPQVERTADALSRGPGEESSGIFASKKESAALDEEKLKKYSEGPKFVMGKKKKKKKLNQSLAAQEEAML